MKNNLLSIIILEIMNTYTVGKIGYTLSIEQIVGTE